MAAINSDNDDSVIYFSDYSTESDSDSDDDKIPTCSVPIKKEPIELPKFDGNTILERFEQEEEFYLNKLLENHYNQLIGNTTITEEEKQFLTRGLSEIQKEIDIEERNIHLKQMALLPPPSNDHIANAMSPDVSSSVADDDKCLKKPKGKGPIIRMKGAKGLGIRAGRRGREPSADFRELDTEIQKRLIECIQLDQSGKIVRLLRQITYNAPYSIVFVPKTSRRRGIINPPKSRAKKPTAKRPRKQQ